MLHNLKRAINLVNVYHFGANNKISLAQVILCKYFCVKPSQAIKCWSCGAIDASKTIQFKCSKCQCLLDLPEKMNHFDLLNVKKSFKIDPKQLSNQFRQIQNILHPDKFSNKSDKEQNLSAEWSSMVNKAYKVLTSPIQRAEYLLKSHQIEIPEGNTVTNSAFLMEMMERNEQIDDAETKDDLVKLLDEVRLDCQKCVNNLEKYLSENKLSEAKDQVILLRYLLSLENSIKEKGNRIGIIL